MKPNKKLLEKVELAEWLKNQLIQFSMQRLFLVSTGEQKDVNISAYVVFKFSTEVIIIEFMSNMVAYLRAIGENNT